MKIFIATALCAIGLSAAPTVSKAQDQFIGQISWFAGNFTPRGWALCDGQILSISQNELLYSLLGTAYGGDGVSTFALPDVRGRAPVHFGAGPFGNVYELGGKGGLESVSLTAATIPTHTHGAALKATSQAADGTSPGGAALAESSQEMYVESGAADVTLAANSIIVQNASGGLAHSNMQPYGTLNCIISLQGIYPPRN
jgi:microcystin-dependent protein